MSRALRWGPCIAYMALIFCLSHRSAIATPGSDKLAHVVAYAGLGALLARALANGINRVRLRTAVVAAVLGTLYGVSDEFHQSFVPGRESELNDVIADAVGATIAATALALRSRSVLEKSEPS